MAAVEMSAKEAPPPAPPGQEEKSGDSEPKPDPPIADQIKEAVMGSKINVLYVFVPISVICGYSFPESKGIIFVCAFLALIPLAAALGDFTEDISLRTNDATAALINVTFGNATELIISIMALRLKNYELIKQSLVGSVLGNMLLVMGTALLLSGVKHPTLHFNPAATNTYMGTIVLSSFAFVLPTAFGTIETVPRTGDNQTTVYLDDATVSRMRLRMSREMAVVMIIVYCGYLYFQQKTHKELFDGVTEEDKDKEGTVAAAPAGTVAGVGERGEGADADGDEEEEEEPKYSFWFSFIAIGIIAILISWLSDFLVDSVEGAAKSLHISHHFIGLILIPIVGNVAEHASAVMLALKGKMDIAVGVAFGSAVQIGLFVMPLLVVIGWFSGHKLDMMFSVFTTAALFASVVLTFTICSSGSSTWLGGAKMTAAYLMLAVAFLNAT